MWLFVDQTRWTVGPVMAVWGIGLAVLMVATVIAYRCEGNGECYRRAPIAKLFIMVVYCAATVMTGVRVLELVTAGYWVSLAGSVFTAGFAWAAVHAGLCAGRDLINDRNHNGTFWLR